MGSAGWGVNEVKFRVRGSVGVKFRVRGSVANRFRVGVSVRNRFREKYCPLLKTSGQLFISHSLLLGEKPNYVYRKSSEVRVKHLSDRQTVGKKLS